MPKLLIQQLALAPGTLYAGRRGSPAPVVRVVGLIKDVETQQEKVAFALIDGPKAGKLFTRTLVSFAGAYVLLPVETPTLAEPLPPAEPEPVAEGCSEHETLRAEDGPA